MQSDSHRGGLCPSRGSRPPRPISAPSERAAAQKLQFKSPRKSLQEGAAVQQQSSQQSQQLPAQHGGVRNSRAVPRSVPNPPGHQQNPQQQHYNQQRLRYPPALVFSQPSSHHRRIVPTRDSAWAAGRPIEDIRMRGNIPTENQESLSRAETADHLIGRPDDGRYHSDGDDDVLNIAEAIIAEKSRIAS